MIAGMTETQEKIRDWLNAELAKMGRGAKSKLAAHLGGRNDAISRMLNEEPTKETREITAHELVGMVSFFKTTPDEFAFAYLPNAGDGKQTAINQKILTEVIEFVEGYFANHNPPERATTKAKAMAAAYDHMMSEEYVEQLEKEGMYKAVIKIALDS